MASLTRLGLCSLSRSLHPRARLLQPVPLAIRTAGISTSKKNKDTVTVTDVITDRAKNDAGTADSTANPKNWVSWGFDKKDIQQDNTTMHVTFFVGITLSMVLVGFIWTYLPDFKMRHWAQREAFLRLREREALGLPPISPDLIELDKFELPSEEEIGSQEIII